MKKITCKKNGHDVNGNAKYLYNFIDTESNLTQKEINKKFNIFGRITKNGINSRNTPNELQESIHEPLSWVHFPVSYQLDNAQKDIDKCNNKKGCNHYCSKSNQEQCEKMQNHRKLMNELDYIQKFLKLDIIAE